MAQTPPSTTARLLRLLRWYGPPAVPVIAAVTYLGWSPAVGARTDDAVIAVLAIALLLLWPRDLKGVAKMAGEVRALRREFAALAEDVVGPLAQHANRSSFTVAMVTGQLDGIRAELARLNSRAGESIEDPTHADGLDSSTVAAVTRLADKVNSRRAPFLAASGDTTGDTRYGPKRS